MLPAGNRAEALVSAIGLPGPALVTALMPSTRQVMKTTSPNSKRQYVRSHTGSRNRRRKASVGNTVKRDGTANQHSAHGKLANVIAMLRTGDGAGIDQIMQAIGWQRHTVRGVISGAKKRLGRRWSG